MEQKTQVNLQKFYERELKFLWKRGILKGVCQGFFHSKTDTNEWNKEYKL